MPGKQDGGTLPIVLSAAQQALGSQAVSLNPFLGTADRIVTPGIYNVRTGEPLKICPRDTDQIIELKSMKSDPEPVLEIIEDVTVNASLTVNVWGSEWVYPYQTLRVSGFEITRAISPDERDAAQYILDNVGQKCRDEVLPFNKPYVVVTAVATADKVETVTGGDVEVVFGIGPAAITAKAAPFVDLERSNRVFAVTGRLVEAETQ